ncbi:MAG: DUF1631 family protein [Rhodanobacter sp.]|jgi:hypothetical protein
MSDELADPPLAHLPDARWPERSQRLLGEVRALCSNWLHQPLLRTLDHFDTNLNHQAERARSHLDQVRYQATRKLLLNERRTFDQRFITSIDQAFDRLGQPVAKPAASLQMLSLVDPLDHELTTSLDQLVARSEARGGVQLIELGYRLAALIASAPLEGPAVPIGPQAMANAFGEASTCLGLPSEHGLLLLQSLEGSLIQDLSALHELINAHLQSAGILPFLRPFVLPRSTPRRERSSPQAPPATTTTGAGTSATRAPDKPAELAPEAAVAGNGKSPGVTSNAELQVAVAALQEHLVQADEQHRLALRNPQRLREDLLIQLAVGRRRDAPRATLSTEQDDALEMIARLFEQMVQQLPPGSEAQTMLGNLQLPMLRAALHDHLFFEQHEHPARRLLGRVAQIARDWFDDTHGETDRALRTRMGQWIERVGRDPPGDVLYLGLLADIDQYLAQLRQRTELAERRQVEAMQGLERLEQARQRCSELLASRFAPDSPQRHRIKLLDDAWRDVLALTLLRHGEQSEVFQTRLVITDQLLGALPMGNRSKLEQEVIAGLAQVGQHGEPGVQMTQHLMDICLQPGVTQAAGVWTATIPLIECSPQPSAQAPAQRADVPAGDLPAPSPSAEILRVHRHLRALPSGTWFEFIDPSGRRGKRRRLVWYSPLSGHSLFVTRRGERAEEFDQLQLATEIARGSIRELAAEQEDMLDNAWHVVTQEFAHAPPHGKPGAGK